VAATTDMSTVSGAITPETVDISELQQIDEA